MKSLKKSIVFIFLIVAISTIALFFTGCNQHKTKIQTVEGDSVLPKRKDSTVVFSRIRQGKVTIDHEYCKQLDDPTRAILFYYASKFSTGFDKANTPLLTVALESERKNFDGRKIIEKWFKGPDRAKLMAANVSNVLPDGATNSTWFTLIAIVKYNNICKVYFRTLDTDDEENYKEATDIFQIFDDHIKVIKVNEFGDIKK